MVYIRRSIEKRLKGLLRTFPAVLVYGPRQCGKSTLVREVFPTWHHIDLERPADLQILAADLEGFFDVHPRRVAIDEAQRLPDLFPVLRYVIDQSPQKGRFLILGSANPTLVKTVSETLAGRIATLELTPFLTAELTDTKKNENRWYFGGFPPVHNLRGNKARVQWLDSYVTTYLERDLPALGLSLPPPRLRILWQMLTHVHGNLLNISDLARSLGVTAPTVSHYLDVLESTFMIRRLPPYHANVQKRLTKRPKIYVRDTGLLHFLAGLRTPKDLSTWARLGASFEGLVIEELSTLAAEQTVRPEIHFWRTQSGAEVDFLLVQGRRILPIEIKLGAAVNQYAVAGLRQCMKDLKLKRGWIVNSSKEHRKVGRGIEVVPWQSIIRRDFRF
jgi:predicted AAA+ superfamily ATPase